MKKYKVLTHAVGLGILGLRRQGDIITDAEFVKAGCHLDAIKRQVDEGLFQLIEDDDAPQSVKPEPEAETVDDIEAKAEAEDEPEAETDEAAEEAEAEPEPEEKPKSKRGRK